MAKGIHITPIGAGRVLLEPDMALDPSSPEILIR